MLYTIMPEEQIFSMEVEVREVTEVEVEGVKLLIELTEPNRGTIVRLLSTNPNHFLNPKYSPGETVEFSPVLRHRVQSG